MRPVEPVAITGADVRPVVASLARAFTDDPLMAHLVPDRRSRPRRAAVLFSAVLRHQHLGHGASYTDVDRHGAALWDPPGHWRMSAGEIARSTPGSLRALRTNLVRATRVLTAMEREHPRQPHWYLAVLGTDPEHQGRGIASTLMAPVLRRCDEEGVGAYLESSNERNVPFYRRHGFEVTAELHLPRGPTIWPMWRQPRPPESDHSEGPGPPAGHRPGPGGTGDG
jgi:ribosomal protein S18 acetylase RimI-like enzyme